MVVKELRSQNYLQGAFWSIRPCVLFRLKFLVKIHFKSAESNVVQTCITYYMYVLHCFSFSYCEAILCFIELCILEKWGIMSYALSPLKRKTTFVTFCVFPKTIKLFQKGLSKMNEFAFRGANSFLFELIPVEKEKKMKMLRVDSPIPVPVLLK